MRSSREVRASDCQCQSSPSLEFDLSIHQRSEICGAADEAMLNTVKYFKDQRMERRLVSQDIAANSWLARVVSSRWL
jgi:hypothetical protein